MSYGSSGACSNDGATYTITGASGTCTVLYNQSGNGNYSAAPQITESVSAQPAPTPTPSATPIATPTPTPSVSPTATPGPGAQSVNISTRGRVENGDSVLIGGFIITGDAPKKVVVRAIGPSITFNDGTPLPGTLQDPVLELHGPQGSLITTNDNWKDTQQLQIEETKLAPKDEHESAIVATLQPGAYTAIVRGKSQTEGIALIEAYDVSASSASQLANISTRGFVHSGDNVMIGGFMLGGDSSGLSRLAIRGLGPSLTKAGVTNPMADPTLDLRDKDGNRILANDDYTDDAAQAAELAKAGLAPQDPKESGIFVILPAGSYTVVLAGKDRGIGIGLLEIYNLR